jgi:hypothetical protein
MSVTFATRISAAALAFAAVLMTWLPTVTVNLPHPANGSFAVSAALA